MYTGDGSGTSRARLDNQGMANLSSLSMLKGHKKKSPK